jgi:hypothetical protein
MQPPAGSSGTGSCGCARPRRCCCRCSCVSAWPAPGLGVAHRDSAAASRADWPHAGDPGCARRHRGDRGSTRGDRRAAAQRMSQRGGASRRWPGYPGRRRPARIGGGAGLRVSWSGRRESNSRCELGKRWFRPSAPESFGLQRFGISWVAGALRSSGAIPVARSRGSAPNFRGVAVAFSLRGLSVSARPVASQPSARAQCGRPQGGMPGGGA